MADSTMFSGRYPHTIDAKGRVSFPARCRETLTQLGDDRIVLAFHPDVSTPCLEAWPLSAWQRIVARARRLPRMAQETQHFMRHYISSALECTIDAQGRVLVPPAYRDQAALRKEVLWTGVADHLELWARDGFELHLAAERERLSLDLNAFNSVFEDEPPGAEQES